MGTKMKPETTQPESLLIDNLKVCQMLDVNPETWRSRVRLGTAPLPHARMGNRSYYRRADVLYYVKHGKWPERVKFKAITPQV